MSKLPPARGDILHTAGVDSYFTMRLFEAYLESNQVDVLGECEGFIKSDYRRFRNF